MWGTIDELELEAPSTYSEQSEENGGFNTTLKGNRRRFLKSLKKIWTFSYDVMKVVDYDALMDKYKSLIPSGTQAEQSYFVFNISDTRFNVIDKKVHMQVSGRTIVPGTDLLSNVEITLLEL